MGKIRERQPVKLIIGFIFKEDSILKKANYLLERRFGKIDFESHALNFTHTTYYEKEFGLGLKRKFISFKKLTLAHNLSKIKITTNNIEAKLSVASCRLINIDPGYLDLSKLVLASTKDYSHRIYLDKGIYAEVTLLYQNKTFRPLEWTYSDYKTHDYIAIFNQLKEIYAKQIKEE